MHRSFAEKHHIPIIPATGRVSLAIATTSSTCTGHTFPIDVTYGQPGHSITRSITFHIVDLNDFDVYIGGNNLEHIGIVIPIATSYPDEITVSDPALTPDPAPAPASTHNTCHNHLPNTNSLLREGGDVVTESFRGIFVFEKHNFLKETFTGYFHQDLEETSQYKKACFEQLINHFSSLPNRKQPDSRLFLPLFHSLVVHMTTLMGNSSNAFSSVTLTGNVLTKS
ncbi:hypothetical protein PROFUN_15777 [Planoprotostelium fungivorum]|uniref:Uncharacterized protein n=1 Tax=Planoprotostelium fungivorum TaxID=1890364 RepID=A0A2P6MQ25_9EUKA|nr:hypothetical protein PROFUN_15777 [Planoprotostelium fungivorum]